MSFRHIYTVPSYYPDFHCKAGECRHPCCTGWDIAISMNEYFRMLGMECSPELRRRLDTAFHLAEEPSENHYAVISPRWDGDCPLHLPNGYCRLQCECGEGAIPSVCRYYPRSPKSKYAYQCQCSNSCEAVVEMLFDRVEPLTFVRQRLSFHIVEELTHEHDPIARLFPAIQRACLHILQDRTRPFSLRMRHLGELTLIMDVPYRQGNAAGLHAVLPFSAVAGNADEENEQLPLNDRELLCALTYLRDYLCWIEENNAQLSEEAIKALRLLDIPQTGALLPSAVSLWHTYAEQMDLLFPEQERMLEQIFVNHLCYDSFPLSPDHHNLWDSYIAFCTAYALVRVLSVCHLAICEQESPKTNADRTAAYADIVSAVFRLVGHTNFVRNTAILSRRFAFDRAEQIMLLCKL